MTITIPDELVDRILQRTPNVEGFVITAIIKFLDVEDIAAKECIRNSEAQADARPYSVEDDAE